MSDKRVSLFDWLGLRDYPDLSKARWLGGIAGFLLLLTALVAIVTAFAGFFLIAGHVLFGEVPDLRDLGYLLIGLIGAPFVVWRTVIAQKQSETAQQGLITDRINKAVAGLGAEKTVKRRVDRWSKGVKKSQIEDATEPNIEVRIGSIYALERISQDSERDHIQIMEILCAYIRENAKASEAPAINLPEWPQNPDPGFYGFLFREEMRAAVSALPPLRTDIQTALEVIGRRSPARIAHERARCHRGQDPYRLDLRQTNLRRADLAHLDFSFALFQGAQLQGASLRGAHLQSANFHRAQMQVLSLARANLESVTLTRANLSFSDFSWTKMQGSHLFHARLQSTNFSWAELQFARLDGAYFHQAKLANANLEGASLDGARLQNTNFLRTQLQGARMSLAQLQGARLHATKIDKFTNFNVESLRGACLKDVDLAQVNVKPEWPEESFGDASVRLPEGTPYPAHWAHDPETGEPVTLYWEEFDRQWRAFQAKIGYQPPKEYQP